MEKQIEQTLDSWEVAEMVDKEHNMLLRDIRRYCKQLGQSNIAQSDFFTESTYKNSQNKEMPCYRITKKGCEFIAHKLTGTKGTAFTARYINRFHEMEDIMAGQAAVQGKESQGLARLMAAVEAQGKMLGSINKKLSCSSTAGIGYRNEEDIYRGEIMRMVELMNDREALCKVYTFAKYVPRTAGV